jgi:hypothetical protein
MAAAVRIEPGDPMVVGHRAVGGQRTNAQTALRCRLDGIEPGQVRDIHQPRRALDVTLHQIDQIGAASDYPGGRFSADLADRGGKICRRA